MPQEQEQMETFIKSALKQVELNRIVHEGDPNEQPMLTTHHWVSIIMEHLGHLAKAVMQGEVVDTEKELLHMAAPMLELYILLKKCDFKQCPHCGRKHIPANFRVIVSNGGELTPERICRLARITEVALPDTE